MVLLKYLVGIGILIWLYQRQQLNFAGLSLLKPSIITLALSLSLLQLILSAWRIQLLLISQAIFLSLSHCILYNALGVFYSVMLPGSMSGDAVKGYYFWRINKNKQCSKASLIGVLVIDRVFGTLSMLFVGLVAATLSASSIGFSIHSIIMLWIMFLGGIFLYLLLCRVHRYNWPVLARIQNFISILDFTSYPKSIQVYVIVLSILIHILSGLMIYLVAFSLHSGLDFSQIMTLSPIGLLINAIPISPGGLGVGEQGFEILFSLLGGQFGGTTFMISRFFIFAPAILGGMYALYLFLDKRNIKFKSGEKIKWV